VTFAPCLCAAQDDRWGRTYESFGEDPKLVIAMESAIDGFQGPVGHLGDRDRVLATAKRFAGDGDTHYDAAATGYKIDQGIAVTTHQDFWRASPLQYVPAVQKASRRERDAVVLKRRLDRGRHRQPDQDARQHRAPHHRPQGVDGVRRVRDQRLGGGIHQLPGDWPTQVRTGINAGIDKMMEPNAYQSFETTLTEEVNAGRVPMSRIDDAVSRILTKKFQLGLFEHPYTDRTDLAAVGSPAHRAVARTVVAKSQVLLKNDRHALPIRTQGRIYVAGSNADSIGNQAGGWTLAWQGGSTTDIPGTGILGGIRQAAGNADVTHSPDATAPIHKGDFGVVVVGETPYSEGFGDAGGPLWACDPADNGVPRPIKDMQLSAADKAAVDKVCSAAAKCVVVVVSGRPPILDPTQLSEIDGLVAAWLPGSEGAGVADTLFGKVSFTGKLPVTWPRALAQEPINNGDATYDPLYPYGFGLTTK
jgi:beta-glucosidase